MRITSAFLVVASASCLQIATAATITEYNRTTFQIALSAATLSGQNFDSLPTGTIVTVNGVTYTPSMGTAVVTSAFLTTTSPNGLGSTSNGFFGAGETLTITFSAPITAFALDINTYASNSGDYQAVVNDGANSAIPSLLDVFPNTETGQFIGFTDSASFTTVVISTVSDPGTGGGSCGTLPTCPFTVDTLVYGSAAAVIDVASPEPSTFLLTAPGTLLLVGLFVRRAALRARATSAILPEV